MFSASRLNHLARRSAVAAVLCGTAVLTGASWARPTVSAPGAKAAFVVVVHADNPAAGIEREELSKIFLKRLTKWPDGKKTEPIDLASRQPARLAFSATVHKKTVGAILAYWQQQIFSGREIPPAEKPTETDVIAFIRTHPGGVGYVSAGSNQLAGIKVLPIQGIAP